MRSDWDLSRKHTGLSEGAFTDDKNDRGGPTNFGITQAVYDAHRRRNRLQVRPVQLMAYAEATAIMLTDYWMLAGCDDYLPGLDYCVFDAAIHHGVAGGVGVLQRALNKVHPGADIKDDGIAGGITKDRADDLDVPTLINAVCDERLDYMKTRDGWGSFEDGWRNRVRDCRKNALGMVLSVPAPAPVAPKPSAPTVDEFRPTNPAQDPVDKELRGVIMIGGLIVSIFAAAWKYFFG